MRCVDVAQENWPLELVPTVGMTNSVSVSILMESMYHRGKNGVKVRTSHERKESSHG